MTAGPGRLRLHPHWTKMATVWSALLALAVAAGPTGCRSCDQAGPPPSRSTRPGKTRTPSGTETGGAGYLETVIASRKAAETTVDMVHMKALWTNLNMHAVMHDGRFPAALKELGDPVLLKAPGQSGQPYRYIPGQTSATPKTSILVYEEQPVHKGGKCMALRAGGTVELLTPDQLKQAVAETRKRLGE
jgi:hypothetical protein